MPTGNYGGNARKTIFDIRKQVYDTLTGVTGNPAGRAAPVDPTTIPEDASATKKFNGLGMGMVGANAPEAKADGILSNFRNRNTRETRQDAAPVIAESRRSNKDNMIFY